MRRDVGAGGQRPAVSAGCAEGASTGGLAPEGNMRGVARAVYIPETVIGNGLGDDNARHWQPSLRYPI